MTEKHQYISFDEKALAVSKKVRDGVRWVFELLRNIAIIGAILYLGRISENTFLIGIAYTAVALLLAYIYSYVEQMKIDLFPRVKRRWLAVTLEVVVVTVIILGGLMAFNIGINVAVKDIADAYLKAAH